MSTQGTVQGVAIPPSNGLGTAGFVCSLVGLFTGGLLSPLGLILSMVALGRQPKGFAVAGVVLGLLGSCGFIGVLIALLVGGLGLVAAVLGLVLVAEPEQREITEDMVTIVVALEGYKQDNRYLPSDLGLLDVRPSALMDPWGNQYNYLLTDDEMGFDIVSAGPLGSFGDDDDISLSRLNELWDMDGQFQVSGNSDGGWLSFSVGDSSVRVFGGENAGKVVIEGAGSTIEIVGDDEGGSVTMNSSEGADTAADADADADADTDTDADTGTGTATDADTGTGAATGTGTGTGTDTDTDTDTDAATGTGAATGADTSAESDGG